MRGSDRANGSTALQGRSPVPVASPHPMPLPALGTAGMPPSCMVAFPTFLPLTSITVTQETEIVLIFS